VSVKRLGRQSHRSSTSPIPQPHCSSSFLPNCQHFTTFTTLKYMPRDSQPAYSSVSERLRPYSRSTTPRPTSAMSIASPPPQPARPLPSSWTNSRTVMSGNSETAMPNMIHAPVADYSHGESDYQIKRAQHSSS
jgi:hypothetical protein